MAASAWRVYREGKKYMVTAGLDIDSAGMRIKVCKGTDAAAISNYTRSTFASCGTAVSFVGNDTRTLTGIVVTALNGSNTMKFDASDKIFTASGNLTSLLYVVIGIGSSAGGKALGWCKLSAATALSATNTLKITMPTNGLFVLYGGET